NVQEITDSARLEQTAVIVSNSGQHNDLHTKAKLLLDIQANSPQDPKANKNRFYLDHHSNIVSIVGVDTISDVIVRLDGSLRTIAALYYIYDLTIEEIAERLEIPLATAQTWLSRANGQLYRLLSIKSSHYNEPSFSRKFNIKKPLFSFSRNLYVLP